MLYVVYYLANECMSCQHLHNMVYSNGIAEFSDNLIMSSKVVSHYRDMIWFHCLYMSFNHTIYEIVWWNKWDTLL